MNQALLKEIVKHIYATFGVIPSDFLNVQTGSLLQAQYLLSDKISFQIDGNDRQGKMWGCQLTLSNSQIKVLLGECTMDPEYPEFSMIIQAKEAPMYGLYDVKDNYAMIATSLNQGKNWLSLNTTLQATFLAAMEYARDLQMPWGQLVDYKGQYQAMVSFLRFQQEAWEQS